MNKVAVTAQAILLQRFRVGGFDLDRFMEIHQRERLAVAVSVVGFSKILGKKIMRQVAIDAGGRGVVGGFGPGVVLWLHDVAIHTSAGIGGKIAKPLAVIEGEKPDTKGGSGKCGNDSSGQGDPHLSDSIIS